MQKKLKEIWIEDTLSIPEKTEPKEILSWANSIIRIKAFYYSHRNLGDLCGIHPIKIWKWQNGDMELMTDELKKVANAIEVKMKIHED